MWYYAYTNELYHHGVKGQRWGVRRYQNENGSLTPKGKAKLNKYRQKELEKENKRYEKVSKLSKKNIEKQTVKYENSKFKYGEKNSKTKSQKEKLNSAKVADYMEKGKHQHISSKIKNMTINDYMSEKKANNRRMATMIASSAIFGFTGAAIAGAATSGYINNLRLDGYNMESEYKKAKAKIKNSK